MIHIMNPGSSPAIFIYPSNIMPRTQLSKIQAAAATKLQTHHRAQQAKRVTAALRSSAVSARSAYKSYLGSHTVNNTRNLPGWDGLEMLYHFLPTLKETFAKYQGLKVHLSALAMYTMSFGEEWLQGDTGQHHTTSIKTITIQSDLYPTLFDLGESLRELITEAELHGSGWVFDHFRSLELHIARYHPVGGAAMEWQLRPQLAAKKAVINVQIRDDGWSTGQSFRHGQVV